MKTKLLALALAPALALAVACGDDTEETPNPNPTPTVPKFDTADKVLTHLDGKTWVMTGEDIPTHPNGINRNMNAGQATQCVHKTTINVGARKFNVVTDMAELKDAPQVGNIGTCVIATKTTTLNFPDGQPLVENVATDASCFDITMTFNGFAQQGRGQLSADGKTLKLEVFLGTAAANHRCANGAVGGGAVTYGGADVTGKSVQTYRLQ